MNERCRCRGNSYGVLELSSHPQPSIKHIISWLPAVMQNASQTRDCKWKIHLLLYPCHFQSVPCHHILRACLAEDSKYLQMLLKASGSKQQRSWTMLSVSWPSSVVKRTISRQAMSKRTGPDGAVATATKRTKMQSSKAIVFARWVD